MSVIQGRINRLEQAPESYRDRPLGERIQLLINHRKKQLTADERELERYYELCNETYPGHTDANYERGAEIHEAIYGDLLPVELEAYHERLHEIPSVLKQLFTGKMEEIRTKSYPQIWAKYAPFDLPYPELSLSLGTK
jgi:hypothetical protein